MRTHSTIALITVVLALIAASCTSSGQATTVTAESVSATTATSAAPVPTTTTETPAAVVAVTGDVPADVAEVTSSFLSALQDTRNETSSSTALIEHHEGSAGLLDDSYAASAALQDLETGGAVGIVMLESGDYVTLADEGSGWIVVGADLASLGFDPWLGESPSRVLVLGSDARPGYEPGVSRTDSIHILTAVPADAAGTILGFPRDSWVSTDYGDMRINAITASGRGPEAAFAFYTQDWDLPLDGYVLTAFSGFEDLVTAAVGRLMIDLERTVPSLKYWPGFREGEQTLTPTRTLDLARTRKGVPGGDITRSYNQGQIMLAVLAMLQQGSVEDAPLLLGELVKYTETNLTPTQLIQLGATAYVLDIESIDNIVLPGSLGRATGGASVVFLDPEAEGIVDDVLEDGLLTPSEG
jgi:LCP family protein required for cell wall assembly